MGWSGKSGFVNWERTTWVGKSGRDAPTGEIHSISEVLAWEVEFIQKVTGFTHADSYGWEDAVLGGAMIRGTIETKLVKANLWNSSLAPSSVAKILLSNAVLQLEGLAVFESMPISTRIDGGEPVSATYRFRSKLEWTMLDGTHDDGNPPPPDAF